ncbi:MAG: helix-turn-helix transcriptional regulator [Phycisphaerales bacterium]|nr:helix-turn-helix transcriptional regulator [Phycisphaerales bacterium]
MARRHATYKKILPLLRKMREDSGLSQRALSRKLRKPQGWVFRTETDRRRIDVLEFVAWAVACGVDPVKALKRFAESL